MGVRGLTKYICERSDIFFEEYCLKDTQLVIDGFNLALRLYGVKHTETCIFGGDYDAYYETVKDFFYKLKKCSVEAFVVFDGGLEQRKLSEYIKRSKEKIYRLRNFQMKKWKNLFFPCFIDEVFVNVLIDLDIKYTTCWFEADQEIASLACFLKCPVLSYDSDFFIYGCLYIPFDNLDYYKLYYDSSSSSGCYIKCMIYDITKFEKHIKKDKCLLPILAALQGNDYVNSKIFETFFNHVSISASKGTYNQVKIKSIIDWLKNETSESVKVNILKHVSKADAPNALRAINQTMDSYAIQTPTRLLQLGLENSGIDNSNMCLLTGKYLSKLPSEFVYRYNKNKIPGVVVDMINLQKYFPMLQVEDVSRESSHCVSLPIINGIYYLVSSLVGIQTKLNVMLKMCGNFEIIQLNQDPGCYEGFEVHSLMSAPVDVRMNFMYKVLSLNEFDISRVELFDKDWKVFAMSFIYWMKNVSKELSECHFHSIVLMTITNFVQSSVGFYNNYMSFMRAKAGALHRLSKESVKVVKETSNLFRDMLESITELECLKLTEKFIKLRKPNDEVTDKGYYMETIHIFAMFQSVLYHVMILNKLLDFPYPDTLVHKMYSGTLIYNLYHNLNKRKNITHFIHELLQTEPNVLRVHNFFVTAFVEYVTGERKREHRTRPSAGKKSRKKIIK